MRLGSARINSRFLARNPRPLAVVRGPVVPSSACCDAHSRPTTAGHTWQGRRLPEIGVTRLLPPSRSASPLGAAVAAGRKCLVLARIYAMRHRVCSTRIRGGVALARIAPAHGGRNPVWPGARTARLQRNYARPEIEAARTGRDRRSGGVGVSAARDRADGARIHDRAGELRPAPGFPFSMRRRRSVAARRVGSAGRGFGGSNHRRAEPQARLHCSHRGVGRRARARGGSWPDRGGSQPGVRGGLLDFFLSRAWATRGPSRSGSCCPARGRPGHEFNTPTQGIRPWTPPSPTSWPCIAQCSHC